MQDDAAESSTEQEPVEKKRGLCAYVHSCGFINVYITTAMYTLIKISNSTFGGLACLYQ